MAGGPKGEPGEYLGSVGRVPCYLARTDSPWDTGADAIVVSVGTTLGNLGTDLRGRYPDAGWSSIPFGEITPDRPSFLPLPEQGTDSLRLAVLVTAHDPDERGDPTVAAMITATGAAIRAAANAGASALAMPMLGTGNLGFSPEEVAPATVPAVVAALREAHGLTQLVFICRNRRDEVEIRAAWDSRSPSGYSASELAGGVSSDRVDPNVGIPLTHDQLNVASYVSMLATVIADKSTPLPLSLGIFGAWGSGKSYFMGLLREEVDQLARSASAAYADEIVQIGFNAWHYADSNLWASLGDEIFRQLAGPGPTAPHRRAQLRKELGARLEQVRELEAAKEQAQATVAQLQADVDEATANRASTGKDLITAVAGSRQVWQHLGVKDEAEQGALLVEQLRGVLTEADALRRSPKDRRGRIALVVAAVIFGVGFLLAAVTPAAREWLAAAGAAFVATAGTGVALLAQAKSGIRSLRRLGAELRGGMDRAASPRIAAVLEEIRQAEAEQRVAEAQLDEVVAQVGELGRRLTELTPGRNLYTFLAERAHGDAYRSKLGLISTIRKDFEQLVELMADWRANPGSGGTAIDRVVLYIDDLDRCSSRQVVEVLEAVHLLLALDLFVVVVGVDPRWLVRSLCSHYHEILDETPGGGWHVTPEDYLEKIINLPLVLPGMSEGSLQQLLRSMVDGHEWLEEQTGTEPLPSPSPAAPARQEAQGIETGSEIDSRRAPTGSADPPRPLTTPEIDLLATLDFLVGTPREAKRLFNLYRMLRATRNLSDASRFLGDDGEPGEYQAVVALLGLLTAPSYLIGRALDTPPDTGRAITGGLVHRPPDATWSGFVADCEPRRDGDTWWNPTAGPLRDDEARDWRRVHHGLTRVTTELELDGLSRFQDWVPVIRHFSYVLPSGV